MDRRMLVLGFVAGLVGGVVMYAYHAELYEDEPIISAALAIAFIVMMLIVSTRPRFRAWKVPTVIAAAAGAVVGVGGLWFVLHLPSRYRAEEGPGFTLEVPEGTVSRIGGYRDGWITIDTETNVRVLWMVGSSPDVDEREAFTDDLFLWFRGIEASLRDDRPYAAPDLPSQSYQARAMGLYDVTLAECGGRLLAVVTGPQTEDRSAIHRHVVESLRCVPDETEEALLAAPPPVTATIPDGWELYDTGVDDWTGYHSDDAGDLVFFWAPDTMSIDGASDRLETDMADWGEVHVLGGAGVGDGDSWIGTIDDEDQSLQLLARLVPCRGHRAFVVYAGLSELDPARIAVASARCP